MRIRDVLGLLAASAVPAVTFALGTPITGGPINTDVVSVLGLSAVFYVFSFTATLIFGVPALVLLRNCNLVRWWSALAAGLIIGSVVSLLIRLPSAPHIGDVLTMAPLGAVSGLVCWLIVRSKPDVA